MPIIYHIYGEGSNDIGDVNRSNKQENQGCYDGFLKKAVENHGYTANLVCERATYLKDISKVSPLGTKIPMNMPKLAKKSYLATIIAFSNNSDWVVIGTDTDREQGTKTFNEIKRIRKRKYEEFLYGYEQAVHKKPEVAEKVQMIVLVPMRKLESWLLADEKAFYKVTQKKRGKLPEKPEELGGKTDPKMILEKLGAANKKLELAEASDPVVLCQECPVSYPPFYNSIP